MPTSKPSGTIGALTVQMGELSQELRETRGLLHGANGLVTKMALVEQRQTATDQEIIGIRAEIHGNDDKPGLKTDVDRLAKRMDENDRFANSLKALAWKLIPLLAAAALAGGAGGPWVTKWLMKFMGE